MTHTTLTRVNFNGKMFEPGNLIRFGADDADVRDELLACGAIAEASAEKTIEEKRAKVKAAPAADEAGSPGNSAT